MKLLALLYLLLANICSLFAQSKPPVLMPGLGQHHHTISTKNPEAQRFFDQGLTLVFAFNHEEAARAFRRASELDPQSAMAFWGIALALGPCINLDVDPPHEQAAFEAVQKALLLAPGATERERDYIHALATRYSSDPKVDLRKLDAEYAIAMRELSKRYPDDLDAATLYAESLMDLHPWKLWSLDGRPTEGTEEIVAVLESVLRRDPNHIGANHYYVHATEASRTRSGRLRVRNVWKPSHPLLVIWYTCPRTRICAWGITPQQPRATQPEQLPTASICERAAQQAACTTCCITATISISSQPATVWLAILRTQSKRLMNWLFTSLRCSTTCPSPRCTRRIQSSCSCVSIAGMKC
jgi:hypothetical protein